MPKPFLCGTVSLRAPVRWQGFVPLEDPSGWKLSLRSQGVFTGPLLKRTAVWQIVMVSVFVK